MNKFEAPKFIKNLVSGGLIVGLLGSLAAFRKQTSECVSFEKARNVNYIPAVWDEENKRFESIFEQLSQPGENGFVEQVILGDPVDGLVTFPIGANVTGYIDETTSRVIKLPDGTSITSYHTCYSAK